MTTGLIKLYFVKVLSLNCKLDMLSRFIEATVADCSIASAYNCPSASSSYSLITFSGGDLSSFVLFIF